MKLRTLMAENGRYLILIVFIAALLAAGASLTTPMSAQEPILPSMPPDAEIGNSLFQERCANCHGPAGQGNGEMSAQLLKIPANYTETEFRRTRIPSTIFSTITNGIIPSGMPPFGPESTNPISEENRWHLVATVYSLATPPEAIASGQAIYEANCLACHGETGLGDGPDAATAQATMPDLSDVRYWFNRSNQTVFEALANGAIADHAYELTDQERWDIVDYARTFSYNYVNPNAPVEPVEGATISGLVDNGTTGDILNDVQVLLRGFDQNFQLTLNMTTTVGTDGRYTFALEPVDPSWVYLASARYNDLGFSSDAGQVSRTAPNLDLPITVFDTTTDPAVVQMDQMHVLLSFGQDMLQVDEFYVFSNPTSKVFVGETGDRAAGTVRLALPEGAQNVAFQRTFGAMDNTIPANEVIQLEDGSYADTLPLNPGNSALNLIASYDLPYEDGMTVSRPLFYQTKATSVIIPGQGVTLSGDDWADQGVQQMPGGSFNSYTRADMAANSEMVFTLNGRPTQVTPNTPGATVSTPANSLNELVVGGVVLLIVIIAAFFIITRRDTADDDDDDESEREQAAIGQLLLNVVDLDDAYDAGQVDDESYQSQRRKLIGELAAIWPVSNHGVG